MRLDRGTQEILATFRKVSVAVIMSAGVTAAVQAIAAMVGFLIAGVPSPFFFTLVTFFLAFIPAIGAAVGERHTVTGQHLVELAARAGE